MIAVILIVFYLVAIVAANLAVAHFGPWALPITAWILIPFDLCSRDILHERWHAKGWGLAWRMALLIFSGSALSVLLNLGALRVAIASFCAFACAGTVDTIVCHLMYKHGRFYRMNGSNFFSAITDSIIFPAIAFGMFSLSLSATQAGAKFAGGIFWTLVLSYIMRRLARRKGFETTSLDYDTPEYARLKCPSCGKEFNTDASTEENLWYEPGVCLHPVCPYCGFTDKGRKRRGRLDGKAHFSH